MNVTTIIPYSNNHNIGNIKLSNKNIISMLCDDNNINYYYYFNQSNGFNTNEFII